MEYIKAFLFQQNDRPPDKFDTEIIDNYSNDRMILEYMYKVKGFTEIEWDSWDNDRGESADAPILAHKCEFNIKQNMSVRQFSEEILKQVEQIKFPFEVFYRLSGPYFLFIVTKTENRQVLLKLLDKKNG